MIIIRLKSGFELPITCEKFTFSRSSITGEITNYDIKGIEDNKPIFFRAEDIECIWQKMDTLKMPYEWIPVSERLPKQQQTVLIQDFGQITIGYLNAENRWRNLTNLDDYLKGVVAWMPLPEPWKGEEE